MDAVQSFFPMDIGMQPTDGLPNGVPLAQNQQQPQGTNNAFAGDGDGRVFMGVSGALLHSKV
jgi:hypothetical protein